MIPEDVAGLIEKIMAEEKTYRNIVEGIIKSQRLPSDEDYAWLVKFNNNISEAFDGAASIASLAQHENGQRIMTSLDKLSNFRSIVEGVVVLCGIMRELPESK